MNDEMKEMPLSFLDAMSDVKPLSPSDTVSTHKPERTLAQKLKRQALEKQSPYG